MNNVRISRSLLLVLPALIAAGCFSDEEGAFGPADAEHRDASDGPVPEAELAALREDVCDPRFMVSYSPDTDCHDVVGPWRGESLFPATAPVGLAGYCTYTWDPDDPNAPAKPSPGHISNLKEVAGEVAPDCMVVLPQGNAITDLVADDLLELFRWRIGWIEPDQMAAAFANPTLRSPVTTAIIDTYPNHQPDDPNWPLSDHGPVVASVVESIACPSGGSCAVSVSPFLGLPRDADGEKHPFLGGYVGRQSDVAVATYDALVAHDGDRLVIHLSVGWDPTLFGGADPTNAPPPVSAVYDALRIARCRGALIVAAAGNTDRLICDEYPLAPGQWQMEPAPEVSECQGLGLANGQIKPETVPGAPLVYAIGGLDQRHSVMPGSRSLGMPRLAASATHTAAQARAGLPGDVVKTGTSLSSAVASGAASLLWSFRPGLSPGELMEILYDEGFDVGEQSTFAPGDEDVRGVDVCAALMAACTGALPNTACSGDLSQLDCDPAFPVSIPEFLQTIADAAGDPIAQSYEPGFTECPATCGGLPPVVIDAPGLVRGCGEAVPDPMRRFTEPQPPKNGCSDCVLTIEPDTEDATAQLTLSDDFEQGELSTVDIVITDTNGRKITLAVSEADVAAGDGEVELENTSVKGYILPLSLKGIVPKGADVIMHFKSGDVTQDPMIVLP